jgi:hypothetical protein
VKTFRFTDLAACRVLHRQRGLESGQLDDVLGDGWGRHFLIEKFLAVLALLCLRKNYFCAKRAPILRIETERRTTVLPATRCVTIDN